MERLSLRGAFGGVAPRFTDTSEHLLTVAFDIGTGFSGYAFAFNEVPLKTYMNKNWTSVRTFYSLKLFAMLNLLPS